MGDEARLLQEILVTGDRDLTKEVALVAGKSRPGSASNTIKY